MIWTTRGEDGKKKKHVVETGVPHNPPPRTARGRRRDAAMHRGKAGAK